MAGDGAAEGDAYDRFLGRGSISPQSRSCRRAVGDRDYELQNERQATPGSSRNRQRSRSRERRGKDFGLMSAAHELARDVGSVRTEGEDRAILTNNSCGFLFQPVPSCNDPPQEINGRGSLPPSSPPLSPLGRSSGDMVSSTWSDVARNIGSGRCDALSGVDGQDNQSVLSSPGRLWRFDFMQLMDEVANDSDFSFLDNDVWRYCDSEAPEMVTPTPLHEVASDSADGSGPNDASDGSHAA